MTIYPGKTAGHFSTLNKGAFRSWLNILLVIFLAATLLPLPGGADGIHSLGGILLLATCIIHLIWHRRWIKTVILDKSQSISPILRRQRRLFWATLLSGFICGLSGLIALPSGLLFLPWLCLVTPIHVLSGMAFLCLNIYHLVLHRNWFIAQIRQVFHDTGNERNY